MNNRINPFSENHYSQVEEIVQNIPTEEDAIQTEGNPNSTQNQLKSKQLLLEKLYWDQVLFDLDDADQSATESLNRQILSLKKEIQELTDRLSLKDESEVVNEPSTANLTSEKKVIFLR